jgi:hypothetical protein
LIWKLFTELLYPISGLPVSENPQRFYIFETVERFGDYGAPAGLFVLMSYRASSERVEPAPARPRAATELRR